MTEDEENQARLAWARIGHSVDGKLARKLLIGRLLQHPDFGALERDAGERIFARKIVDLLDADLDERSDDNAASPRRRSPGAYARPVRG